MTPTDLSDLKCALFDVIDAGDPNRHRADGRPGAPWLLYDTDEAFANEQRVYFVSAVLKHIRTYQPPNENLARFRAMGLTAAPRKVCSDESHKGYGQAGCLDCTTAPGPKEQGVTHSMVVLPDYSPQADEILICDKCDTVQPGYRGQQCLVDDCCGELRIMQQRDFKEKGQWP
jgi:hypothetical protein